MTPAMRERSSRAEEGEGLPRVVPTKYRLAFLTCTYDTPSYKSTGGASRPACACSFTRLREQLEGSSLGQDGHKLAARRVYDAARHAPEERLDRRRWHVGVEVPADDRVAP